VIPFGCSADPLLPSILPRSPGCGGAGLFIMTVTGVIEHVPTPAAADEISRAGRS